MKGARAVSLCWLVAATGGFWGLASAEDLEFAPIPSARFDEVLQRSPFLRALDVASSYRLRSVANVGDEQIATITNQDTGQALIVRESEANAQGMRLVKVSPADDLAKVTVTLSVGGESIVLHYDPQMLAGGSGGNDSALGGVAVAGEKSEGGKTRKGPSEEDVALYQSLTPAKREQLQQFVRQTMLRHPDMSREQRMSMIREKVRNLAPGGAGK